MKWGLALSIIFSTLAADEEKPFFTATLIGQMGNMLFQIATASAVAWEHGALVYFPDLPTKPTLYQHLFSRCKALSPEHETSVIRNEGFPIPFEPKMRLDGYFQEERYFLPYKSKLVELFAPTTKDSRYIQKKYGTLLSQPNTVGVQIRFYRREVVDGFPQYGKHYLEKAMALFPEDSLFIVSSDCLEYAKKQIPPSIKNVIFLEDEPAYIDFYILGLCKDNIITNSSFGWWSAWLNQNPNKKVICPSYWTSLATEEIFPKDWIRIEAEAEEI